MDRTNREWTPGSVAGLTVMTPPAALLGFLLLWLLAAWSVTKFRDAGASWALRAGFLMAVLHSVSELFHHIGHAMAAWSTGYPMVGVRFGTFLFFATSLYPENEPGLPAAIHIRRALGGPAVSVAIGLLAGLIVALARSAGGLGRLLIQFIFLENLLLLGLGAFVPLGFTDGSTILHYWRRS